MMNSSRSSKKLTKYRLQVTRTFEKSFRKLDIQTKKKADLAIRNLETDLYAGKPLRGDLAGKWSLRTGDYRIIYTIIENEQKIILCDVEHRKKVYK